MAAEEHVENGENEEKSVKRKREPSVLDNFTKLTNGQENVRIKSGLNLLKHLTENEHAEKADDELKYALGRLIRGLGSSKIHARTGFFAALVGLLNLKNVSVQEIFEHVTKELHKGGSNSKSENADICSGQILVAGAILRSNSYETCDISDKTKVLQLLLNAGKERMYLRLASYKFLSDLFEKVDSKEFEKVIFPLIKNELAVPWQGQNLDNLYLLLEVQKHFPESLHVKFLKNNLGTAEVVGVESLHHLCNTLTTIPRALALKHPVFDLFVKRILETNFVEQFFTQLDSTLAKSNRNKYFAFTKLLSGTLENLNDPTLIPEIFTKNYIQQTINMYKNSVGKHKDKEFQDVTQKLFETLLSALKKEGVKSKIKIKVIKKFLFHPGTFIFEKVTRSKVIQNITATLNTDGVKKLAAIYRDVVLAVDDKIIAESAIEKWRNADRVYASHLLVKLTNHTAMHEENEWKIEQLVFLAKLGLLRDGSNNVGGELADSLKETFYSSLELKLSKLDDLRLILSKIVHEFEETINEDPQSVLRDPLEPEHFETWKKTLHLITKLDENTKKKNAVFHTLFLHLGLQLFNNSQLAASSLTELFSCYERTKKSKKNEEMSSEDPLWIEVITDLFLNLLSHNSHVLRNVINCVFPHLCKYMNPAAIHHILSVLDPKNESNPLSKPNEESEDEDEEMEEENEDEGDSSSDEEVENEEEEEDDEVDDENVNDKLRMALHQALGANAESDAESIDLDNLDDEEGEKLNEALGQAFKQFKPNLGRSKKQKKDDEALTHFRVRVLDLIEIYLDSNPSMMLTLEIMLPLLQLLEFCIKDTHQKPLQDRISACLKKLTSLKKFSDCEDVTEEILVDLLKSLVEKGTKNVFMIQEMSEKISNCCIFVITCSQILRSCQVETETPKKKHKNRIIRVVKEGLEAYFCRRDCVIPYVLFKNVIQMNWEGIIPLVPLLKGFVFANNVRNFRRTQALELLRLFYHNQRFISSHLEELKAVEAEVVNFLRDCVDFFREFSNNPTERKVKEKFICNLFELLHTLKSCVLAQSFEGWALLGEAVRECRSQITVARDTKLAFKKLCKSLNVSNIVQMKQKTIKLNNVEDDEPVMEVEKLTNGVKKEKKKKKNMSKDKLKMKKESKQLRMQSLSEGLNNKRKFDLEEVDDSKKAKLS